MSKVSYAQFVASTAECCGEGGIKAWDYVRMGFLSRMGVLNNWLSEEESLWIQSRIHLRALRYYRNWRQYFAGYTFGRQYWQSPEDDNLQLLREFLARKEYDDPAMICFINYLPVMMRITLLVLATIGLLFCMPGNA